MRKPLEIDVEELGIPAEMARNERTVKQKFWAKLARYLGRVPFAERAVAAYYCAFDPKTPVRAKAYILGALAYFILPIDVVPDFILGVGFGDDLTVLATVYGLIQAHVTDEHLDQARTALERLREGKPPPVE